MRIVTWNCNGALRKKFKLLSELDADIYIIQECENPVSIVQNDYNEWSLNHLWIGDSKSKGIGIFARQELKISKLPWSNTYKDHTVKYFLPTSINNNFDLLAVWTHKNNSPNFGYIGQFWKYLQTNKDRIVNNTLIAGDFNSNVIWDEWDRWWNHSDVVSELNKIGIDSIYHKYTKEDQGKESIPTFYLHKDINKSYHIDYLFGSNMFSGLIQNLEIGKPDLWLKLSDHMPVICDFDVSK